MATELDGTATLSFFLQKEFGMPEPEGMLNLDRVIELLLDVKEEYRLLRDAVAGLEARIDRLEEDTMMIRPMGGGDE